MPSSNASRSADEAVKLHHQARESLASADAAYRRTLVSSLASSNPYERRLATERLDVMPHLVNADVAEALVPLLAETEKLYSESCANIIARLNKAYGGQGEELEYARCQHQDGTSNGTLAGRLLERTAMGGESERVLSTIAKQVEARPSSVDAVITSLGPAAASTALPALAALAKARDADARVALLRLGVAGRCGSVTDSSTLQPVRDALKSAEAKVRRAAALALLRLSGCDANSESLRTDREAARSLVEARLSDPHDSRIVDEVAWLGPAATVFVPALLRRLELTKADQPAVIGAIAAVGDGASAAVPNLIRILNDRSRSHLHAAALNALGRIGPAAASAKPAIVSLLAGGALPSEGLRALAAVSARLNQAEFSRLNAQYRQRCKEAGSIPFFDLSRDAECAEQEAALTALAELSGSSFREVHWER